MLKENRMLIPGTQISWQFPNLQCIRSRSASKTWSYLNDNLPGYIKSLQPWWRNETQQLVKGPSVISQLGCYQKWALYLLNITPTSLCAIRHTNEIRKWNRTVASKILLKSFVVLVLPSEFLFLSFCWKPRTPLWHLFKSVLKRSNVNVDLHVTLNCLPSERATVCTTPCVMISQ